MAYEKALGDDGRCGAYATAVREDETICDSPAAPAPAPSARRDSIVSHASFEGSDGSTMMAGPMTPILRTFQGSFGQPIAFKTASIAYNSMHTTPMSVDLLDNHGQEDPAFALQKSLSIATKTSQTSWDRITSSIASDAAPASRKMHRQDDAFFAHSPANFRFDNSTSAYSTSTIFGCTISPSTFAPTFRPNCDPNLPSLTVTPEQTEPPSTPSPPVLASPFTTPIKKEQGEHLGSDDRATAGSPSPIPIFPSPGRCPFHALIPAPNLRPPRSHPTSNGAIVLIAPNIRRNPTFILDRTVRYLPASRARVFMCAKFAHRFKQSGHKIRPRRMIVPVPIVLRSRKR